jgi:hypothetical protein
MAGRRSASQDGLQSSLGGWTMAGHFHYRGAHYGLAPREARVHSHPHRGLYLFALALLVIVAFAWTRQPMDQLLPTPAP